jgi:hypothetical protein
MLEKIFKWMAHITSVLASVFFLIYIFGGGIPELLKGGVRSFLPFLPFLGIGMFGVIYSFFNQKRGAYFMLFGGLLIAVYLLLFEGWVRCLFYSLPYVVPAILLLTREKVIKRKRKRLEKIQANN